VTTPYTEEQAARVCGIIQASDPDPAGLPSDLARLRRGETANFWWSCGHWERVENGVAVTSPRAGVWLRVSGRCVAVTALPPALLVPECAARFAGAYEKVALLAVEVQVLLNEVRS
jgi:hypothetical protein